MKLQKQKKFKSTPPVPTDLAVYYMEDYCFGDEETEDDSDTTDLFEGVIDQQVHPEVKEYYEKLLDTLANEEAGGNYFEAFEEDDFADDYGQQLIHLFEEEDFYDHNVTPAKSERVGRNEPCPCGSGKKYKKCCWNK